MIKNKISERKREKKREKKRKEKKNGKKRENETKESCTSAHPGCTSLTTSTYSRTGGMEVEEIVAGCVRKGCTGDETAPAPKGTVGMSHQRQDKNQES